MELTQRGVYVGRERVREFLFTQFGAEGPRPGFLGNNLQLQPVIHIAEDGLTATSRHHMFQQMGRNGSGGSWGGAVYENEYVKEEGVWKFKKLHACNTFTANYEGGWALAPGRRLPGPNRELPPNLPPSVVYQCFPDLINAPFHFSHPVTKKEVELPLTVVDPDDDVE